MLLQYKTCKSVNVDGTVDIPIAVESLYGFIFAKLYAKYAKTWTPRVELDPDAQFEIESMRSMAINSVLTKPFKRRTELSENALNRYKARVFSRRSIGHTYRQSKSLKGEVMVAKVRAYSSLQRAASPISFGLSSSLGSSLRPSELVSSNDSQFSELHPLSNSECNMNSQSGAWEYRQYPFLPLSNPLQHCCAQACSALISTIGVSPTMLMMDTCCAGCNKHSCVPASSLSVAAISLMTAIDVPDLNNANVTTVTITI
jgi:hypothetical protein